MLSKCYNILIRIIIRLQGYLRAFLYVHFDRTISEEELVCINEQRKHSKTILLFTHEMSLTGAPRALFNLSLVLKKNGFYVMIASLVPGPLEKEELVPSGIPFILLNIPKIANTYCFSLNLKKYISSFDMILFNTIATLPIVEGIVDVNIKKVCWIHEGAYGFRYNPYKFQFPILYQQFDKLFVVGEYARGIACSYGEKNIIIENLIYGIDAIPYSRQNGNRENKKVVMILAGSIEERKGQLVLLESLSLLSAEIMDQLDIYLIGSTLDKNIETLLKESAYDCLKLIGVMQHNDLMAFYEKMDILLCPSLDDPMPIVCTEAMMLSKPIIVSDCTGTASFINEGENGYIVKAGDAHSLALAIEKAVKSKNLLPSLGEKARSVFENNFTNEVFEQRIKEKLIPVIYS